MSYYPSFRFSEVSARVAKVARLAYVITAAKVLASMMDFHRFRQVLLESERESCIREYPSYSGYYEDQLDVCGP